MSYKGISDFRSDTVTRPTEEMRKAMYEAEVGDDVLGDDFTVKRLEELAARKLGKESGLFVPSGTMGNTIALKVGVEEGKEVLLEEKCHIYNYEAGNISRIARCLPRPLPSDKGKILLDSIENNIHKKMRAHIPETGALTLENTHNFWGGTVISPQYIKKVKKIVKKYDLHFHLDGARVFNAAVALGIDVKDITKHFDSVMFCLSKGLSAPIGSILVGDKDFIQKARIIRKYFGGGMRQVGIIAAAGIVSLEKMIDRLEEDHIRAKKLAKNIEDIGSLEVNSDEVVTSFVMLKLKKGDSASFVEELKKEKVLALPFSPSMVRIVVHKDIDDNDIDRAINAIRKIA